MLRKVLSLLFFIGFLVNGNLIAQSNLFTNESLTGTTGVGTAPDSWKSIKGSNSSSPYSADLNSLNSGIVGLSNIDWEVSSPSNSGDGGTWAGLGAIRSSSWYEGIYQQVSLTANETYTISFEISHFGEGCRCQFRIHATHIFCHSTQQIGNFENFSGEWSKSGVLHYFCR